MKKLKIKNIFVSITALLMILGMPLSVSAATTTTADACKQGSFLGLPKWNKYLNCDTANDPSRTDFSTTGDESLPVQAILAVMAAIIEMLTTIAGIISFFYLLFGFFRIMTSQGESGPLKSAWAGVQYAAIGLFISVSATVILNYIGGKIV